MKKTLFGMVLLLMIVGNLIHSSNIQVSAADFTMVPTPVVKKSYLPSVMKVGDGRPVAGYFASSNDADAFYVLPDRASIKNYSATITISGCGTYKITHTTTEAIANNQFAFSGSFYASGTFSSPTTASGTVGFNKYNIPGCREVTGGPWSWNATWKNSTQPDMPDASQ